MNKNFKIHDFKNKVQNMMNLFDRLNKKQRL